MTSTHREYFRARGEEMDLRLRPVLIRDEDFAEEEFDRPQRRVLRQRLHEDVAVRLRFRRPPGPDAAISLHVCSARRRT